MPVEENITEIQETQETPSNVITTEEVQVAPVETKTEVNEEINLAEILDWVLKSLEEEDTKTETKTFWPNITEPVHESEAKVLLDTISKELEQEREAKWAIESERTQLLADLEDIQTKYELASKEVETYKSQLENFEQFVNSIGEVPVLWELVRLFAEKWAEAVDIPKYLKDLHESRVMAQSAQLQWDVQQIEEKPQDKVSSLEQAILKRNKR